MYKYQKKSLVKKDHSHLLFLGLWRTFCVVLSIEKSSLIDTCGLFRYTFNASDKGQLRVLFKLYSDFKSVQCYAYLEQVMFLFERANISLIYTVYKITKTFNCYTKKQLRVKTTDYKLQTTLE